jgi:hypothetical protein
MGEIPIRICKRKQRLPLKHAKGKEVLGGKFEDFEFSPLDTQHLFATRQQGSLHQQHLIYQMMLSLTTASVN